MSAVACWADRNLGSKQKSYKIIQHDTAQVKATNSTVFCREELAVSSCLYGKTSAAERTQVGHFGSAVAVAASQSVGFTSEFVRKNAARINVNKWWEREVDWC